MTSGADDAVLDAVLAVQITVGWAGETSKPKRLGWWNTDVTDAAVGGDLMARLLPRTHRWAGLEAAREAAHRTDARARARMGDPDRLRTLFFLGFAVDEALADRLALLKAQGRSPGCRACSMRGDSQGLMPHSRFHCRLVLSSTSTCVLSPKAAR